MDIRIFGRILIKTYHYELMGLSLSSDEDHSDKSLLSSWIHELDLCPQNLNHNDGCGYALRYQRYVKKYQNRVMDFIFYDKNEAVGYAYVFLRGTKDKILEIRNAEAYISQIEVFSHYRGQGYSKEMLKIIGSELREIGIKKLYLAVNPENNVALNLYKTMEFKKEQDIKYIRILGINVPKPII